MGQVYFVRPQHIPIRPITPFLPLLVDWWPVVCFMSEWYSKYTSLELLIMNFACIMGRLVKWFNLCKPLLVRSLSHYLHSTSSIISLYGLNNYIQMHLMHDVVTLGVYLHLCLLLCYPCLTRVWFSFSIYGMTWPLTRLHPRILVLASSSQVVLINMLC